MAVMSGCFGASASFPLLWDYVIDSSDGVTLPRIFYLWCVIYALSRKRLKSLFKKEKGRQ